MIAWDRFGEADWDGWAGATPFDDGSEPLIACLTTFDAVAIHDASGLAVYVGDDLETCYSWRGDAETGKQALTAVAGVSDLTAVGFIREDN